MPHHFHWMVFVRKIEVEILTKKELKHQGATGRHPLNKFEDEAIKIASNSMCNTKDNDGVTTSRPVKLRNFNQPIGILFRSYTRAVNKKMKIIQKQNKRN